MNEKRKKALEAKGFTVGTVGQLLGLSPEEERMIEIRVILAETLEAERAALKVSQVELAKRMGSSQPRLAAAIAKAEASTVDYFLRGLLALKVPSKTVALAISKGLMPAGERHSRRAKSQSARK